MLSHRSPLRDRFKLVHDGFYPPPAGGESMFPDQTGLVHISGVEDPGLAQSSIGAGIRVRVASARSDRAAGSVKSNNEDRD